MESTLSITSPPLEGKTFDISEMPSVTFISTEFLVYDNLPE